jgi:hypothetical protein
LIALGRFSVKLFADGAQTLFAFRLFLSLGALRLFATGAFLLCQLLAGRILTRCVLLCRVLSGGILTCSILPCCLQPRGFLSRCVLP